jgi:hypothetical protein
MYVARVSQCVNILIGFCYTYIYINLLLKGQCREEKKMFNENEQKLEKALAISEIKKDKESERKK